MKDLLKLIGYLALIVPSAVINAWALTTVWGWFLVPWGLPPLTQSAAIGIAAVAPMLRARPQDSDRSFWDDAAWALLAGPMLVAMVWPLWLLFGVR